MIVGWSTVVLDECADVDVDVYLLCWSVSEAGTRVKESGRYLSNNDNALCVFF